MTAVIDENGDLFGYVNVIDALFILLILAVVIAGVSFVTQAPPATPTPPEPAPHTFGFTAEVSPPVATAMMDREPTGNAVLATDEVVMTSREQVWRDERFVTVVTMEFVATLPVIAEDGIWRYHGDRLLIGQTYRLDLGYTIVDATLMQEVSDA